MQGAVEHTKKLIHSRCAGEKSQVQLKSIRDKLVRTSSLVFLISFAILLYMVGHLNTQQATQDLAITEANIRQSLIDKGNMLVNNNSWALQGMVEDNAFSAVQELVKITVKEDKDIVYGIFMDTDRRPWIIFNENKDIADSTGKQLLEDELSIWASQQTDLSYLLLKGDEQQTYEFIAPVIVEEETLGFIRYGFSTASLEKQLQQARIQSQKNLHKTLLVLIVTVVLTLIAGVVAFAIFATQLTIPLNKLKNAAADIAKGNYDHHVAIDTNDEIGVLAENFESMRTTVKNKMAVIEQQNRDLEVKVEQRTSELAQKTNDISSMLSNLHQGLFTITDGGLIHPEYSKYLEVILNTTEIANAHYIPLLFSKTNLSVDQLDQIQTAIDSIIGFEELMFEFNSHILPQEYKITLTDGSEKDIELDWDPIVYQGEVERLMVTVRDVTELNALQLEAQQQKRELEVIGQILAIGIDKFVNFRAKSLETIQQCKEIILSTSNLNIDVINRLFQLIHTVKGNARTFDLSHVTDLIHQAESKYDQLRKQEVLNWSQTDLLADLRMAEECIDYYQTVAVSKLGISESNCSVVVDGKLTDTLLNNIENFESTAEPVNTLNLVRDSYRLLISSQAKPLSQVLNNIVTSLPSLAFELKKPSPQVEINDSDIFFEKRSYNLLSDVFTHLFRNALDHGLEDENDRKKVGKPNEGKISVDVKHVNQQALITVFDDGRGLNVNKIYSAAVAAGEFGEQMILTDDQIANFIFLAGLTTTTEVTTVSGRGVGMDSVKNIILQAKGDIRVELLSMGEDAEYRPFKIIIGLPASYFRIAPAFLSA